MQRKQQQERLERNTYNGSGRTLSRGEDGTRRAPGRSLDSQDKRAWPLIREPPTDRRGSGRARGRRCRWRVVREPRGGSKNAAQGLQGAECFFPGPDPPPWSSSSAVGIQSH